MSTAKEILVKPIDSKSANSLCKILHYSGKVVPNSQIHFGVFINNRCEGIMQFGPSLCKKRMMNLVPGTSFNGFLELNRMAFSERLPKNSESRGLSIAHKIIKKTYKQIDWIVTFADGCQCGDGTIYRAAGYKLIQIKKNTSMWVNKKTNEKMQDMQFYHKMIKKNSDWEPLDGYMLKYIYFLNKSAETRANLIYIPFDDIPELVKMYKGKKCASSKENVATDFRSVEGGAIPTDALQFKEETNG